MTKNLLPKDRQAQILAEALVQAAHDGYTRIERQKIADALGVSAALVSKHFGTMANLKRDVMRYAVRKAKAHPDSDALAVLAQGLTLHDRLARNAPEALKEAALKSLLR